MTKKLKIRNTMTAFRIFAVFAALVLIADCGILLLDQQIHFGTVLPFLIGWVVLLALVFRQHINHFLNHHATLRKLWKMGWGLFGIWLITLLAFFGYLQYHSHQQQQVQPARAILVLGSGLVKNQPSPILKTRLDRAAEVAQQIPEALIIMTGGLGYQQHISEAEVMRDYLVQNYQIPASQIGLEDASTSTELNLVNAKPILKQHEIDLKASIAIVTSDFHLPRAIAIAHKQGYYQVQGYAAPTPLATRYNAWFREYFAYISGWILQEYN